MFLAKFLPPSLPKKLHSILTETLKLAVQIWNAIHRWTRSKIIYQFAFKKNVMLPLIKITKIDEILFFLNQSKKVMTR